MTVYEQINQRMLQGRKQLAVLIDPDKSDNKTLEEIAARSSEAGVDYFFVGGSLLINNRMDDCIKILKQAGNIPVILFPGNTLQMSNKADAILFLSLISGRNAEMLIGRHVIAAPYLKLSNLEVIPTGYMLIESGRPTAVSYMSNSDPIPSDKNDIAICTAMAGEMLGLKLIFMDAGSGALNAVSESMISQVKQSLSIPLLVGGGIRTPEKAAASANAGADLLIIGNATEHNPSLIAEMCSAIGK
ncbi:Geranylgeranylglyceryl phosphate synthase [bioreactor metagenome]|uniref:phosphoglycerol geranylgeranyltransferase n=1 Tax=bioreactor metagenome TaxID=1076179 RepID=A0A644U9T4_9ZZZZ|nr:geranylgeranylglyceryl/heptaprenylglyceryl phosphate synthase [Lentimicrobium sp.]MEA5110761.1 geranylgeranylglyceryl/heptaprenylglyceryl phosphate synthase [Lentimicrobium sp.]